MATDSLHQLIYCSRNIIDRAIPGATNAEVLEREIRAILAVARRNNQANGVTGALLFTASGFAQVLEGARDTVECTFERIGSDPRHTDVNILRFGPIESRTFPDWSMGFCDQTLPGAADPLAHLLTDANFGARRSGSGDEILRLLENVVRREPEWISV